MSVDLGRVTYEEWVKFVFDHSTDAVSAWWFEDEWDWSDPNPNRTVEYCTRLFRFPLFLKDDYTPEQIDQGFCFVASGAGSGFLRHLLDDAIPWPVRRACIMAIGDLFERLFSVPDEFDDSALFMWWDVFPSWGKPQDPAFREFDETVLSVMGRILNLPYRPARASALHGLNHWHRNYPTRVVEIIDRFIDANPNLDERMYEMALGSRKGRFP